CRGAHEDPAGDRRRLPDRRAPHPTSQPGHERRTSAARPHRGRRALSTSFRRSMPWLILLLAGFLEICWAAGLKYSNGLTNLRWTAFAAVTLIGSMVLLAQAVRTLPLGTAYAVWTGIGAAGTAILGIVLFGEPRTILRLVCIGLILLGILGLRLAAGETPQG